jgi:hypothetical protein
METILFQAIMEASLRTNCILQSFRSSTTRSARPSTTSTTRRRRRRSRSSTNRSAPDTQRERLTGVK